jgi:DNA transposition AAA+ family ATPase
MIELQERCRAVLHARPDISTRDLAAFTDLGGSTVRNFIGGSQPLTERIQTEIGRVLDQVQAGEILQPGAAATTGLTVTEDRSECAARRVTKRHDVYETEMIRRVAQVLDYCAEHAAIGVITAGFGAGKTEAVAAWRRGSGSRMDSVVFEFDEFTRANKLAFIAALAELLGMDSQPVGASLFRAVCAWLQKNPTTLIFDQAEAVGVPVFQTIRQIHDRTRAAGVGVVLLSAPVLLTRLAASRASDLGALTSRVGIWAPLTGVSKPEMAAILKAEQITDVEDAAFDLWWRAVAGSMRRLIGSIDLVKAKHGGKRISERTLQGMACHLWGLQAGTAL